MESRAGPAAASNVSSQDERCLLFAGVAQGVPQAGGPGEGMGLSQAKGSQLWLRVKRGLSAA